MRFILVFVYTFLFSQAIGQTSLNMALDGTFDGAGVIEYSDIWGYTAPNGTEVAILGGREEIFFLDVTDPANIVVILEHEVLNLSNGSVNNSIWRDFKTFGTKAYACADQGTSGLLVFDLSQVPTSVSLDTQTNAFFNRSHNIYIDEQNGWLYTAGANSKSNGTKILDLNADPANPTEIASLTLTWGYIHDIHVVDNIGYASHGSDQLLSIYDFSDTTAFWIKDIDLYPEPGYNHSAWLDASGNRLVFADETHGQSLKVVNPNLSNFQTSNFHLFKSQLLPNNSNSIGHNPFVLGDLAFIAYYHDGVQVFDISDTNNIVNVAYYDTYPGNTGYGGYEGAWGVYPYLASGRILVSDISTGLYIVTVTGTVLPLNFLDFTATRENKNARLRWKSSVPDEGDMFVVEHSTDGVKYERLSEVMARHDQLVYEFTHPNIGPGTHFYRIRGELVDGSEKMTEIRSIQLESENVLEVFPSVTTSQATLDVYKAGDLKLYDVNGRVVWSAVAGEATQIKIDLGNYPAGQYFVEFKENGGLRQVVQVTRI